MYVFSICEKNCAASVSTFFPLCAFMLCKCGQRISGTARGLRAHKPVVTAATAGMTPAGPPNPPNPPLLGHRVKIIVGIQHGGRRGDADGAFFELVPDDGGLTALTRSPSFSCVRGSSMEAGMVQEGYAGDRCGTHGAIPLSPLLHEKKAPKPG